MFCWPRLTGDGIFIGADDTAAHAADRPGAAAVCKQRGELDEVCSARNACVERWSHISTMDSN